jgi:hypothetical protein
VGVLNMLGTPVLRNFAQTEYAKKKEGPPHLPSPLAAIVAGPVVKAWKSSSLVSYKHSENAVPNSWASECEHVHLYQFAIPCLSVPGKSIKYLCMFQHRSLTGSPVAAVPYFNTDDWLNP